MHVDREMAPVTCQTWAVWLKVPERKKNAQPAKSRSAGEPRARDERPSLCWRIIVAR